MNQLWSVLHHPGAALVIRATAALAVLALVRWFGKPMLATAGFAGLFLAVDLAGRVAPVTSLVRAIIVFAVAGFVLWLVERVENALVCLGISVAGMAALLYFR